MRSRVDEEISIGDYVLSGGELPALVIVDAVARLIPGVVGDEQSVAEDSFSRGLLDFPHYTRPAEIDGGAAGQTGTISDALKVPDVLLSGNHAEIRRWRKREALRRTLARRPDLLDVAALDDEEQEILRELIAQQGRIRARRSRTMGAIELVEKSQLAERPAMKSGDTVRVHVKVREGDKERIQIFEGRRHRPASRRDPRVVHGAQGVVRPGRRAYLPAALADDSEGRSHAVGQGPPREAVLPARSEGQGGAHEGRRPRASPSRRPADGSRSGPAARSRTRCAASASAMWPASTKSGAAAWPVRSWPPRSCSIPTATSPASAIRRSCRRPSAKSCSSEITAHAVAWAVASADPREIDHINIHQASLTAMRRAVLTLAPLPDIVLVDAFRVPELPMAQRGVTARRSPLRRHRRGVDRRQGRSRSPDDRTARPRSALRLRSAQGLRDRRSSRRRRAVRLLRRAPPLVPPPDAV